MFVYAFILLYISILIVMALHQEMWFQKDWQAVFFFIPVFYLLVFTCIFHYNIGCEFSKRLRARARWIMYELIRWSIIVTMVYGWWNVYMFTVLHSLVCIWGILESTYIKSRITFV